MPRWRALRPRDPYYQAWLSYRRETRSAYRGMVHLGGFVALAIVLLVIHDKAHAPTIVGVILAALLGAVGRRLFNVASLTSEASLDLPCPRCGQPFLRGPSGANGWARRCLNCGLPKWAPGDGSPQVSTPTAPS